MSKTRARRAESFASVLLLFAIVAFFSLTLRGFGLVVGLLCFMVALAIIAISGWRRSRAIRRWQTVGSLYALSPSDFETHVAETYRNLGYSVRMTARVGDQGVDILAHRNSDILAIQCKRYADHAPNSAVQAVHAGRTHYGCTHAVLVCLGGFSGAARELATSTGVQLIDGSRYADLVAAIGPRAASSARNFLPRGRSLLYVAIFLIVGIFAIAINRA